MIALGTVLAAAKVAAPLIGSIIQRQSAANRGYRKEVKKDLKALETGDVGLTEAEKRARLAEAQRAMYANQDYMAAQNPQSGTYINAMAAQQNAAAMGTAASSANIQAQSDALAVQRKQDILNRALVQGAKDKEDAETISQQTSDVIPAGTSGVSSAQLFDILKNVGVK